MRLIDLRDGLALPILTSHLQLFKEITGHVNTQQQLFLFNQSALNTNPITIWKVKFKGFEHDGQVERVSTKNLACGQRLQMKCKISNALYG